jgi:hypothetical protein
MSKIVKLTESDIANLVKRVLKEDEDSMGKFSIVHAGVPVNQIMVSIEASGVHSDVTFTIDISGEKPVIVDMFNYSDKINDEEVKAYVEHMIENGGLKNVPDFISFDVETGEVHVY